MEKEEKQLNLEEALDPIQQYKREHDAKKKQEKENENQ